jgi:hypothetical protein
MGSGSSAAWLRARDVSAGAALVLLGAACVGLGRPPFSTVLDLAWAVWAPATGMALLVGARLVRRAPVPPLFVPSVVALPVLSTILLSLQAPPSLRLRPGAYDMAADGTLRLVVLGLALGVEALARDARGPGRHRIASVGSLVATLAVGFFAVEAARLVSDLDSGFGAFDVEVARALGRVAQAAWTAGAAVLVLLVIALHALATAPSGLTRLRALSLTLVAGGLASFGAPLRGALAPHEDPMATALGLGVAPPTQAWTEPLWVGASSRWRRECPLVVVRAGAPPTFVARPTRGEPLRDAPWPRPGDRSADEVVVLTAAQAPFRELLAGLAPLGGRRHGLWLAVAPPGWQELRGLRRLAGDPETLALGVEPGASFDDGLVGEGDALLPDMDPTGHAIGLVPHTGQEARCVLLDVTLVDATLRFTRRGDCGSLSLDDGSRGSRLARLRETEARRVFLAPEPEAAMDDVARVAGTLSSELTRVLQERWDRACPSPMRCEPHVSFETGSPLVWLTGDRQALER